MSVNSVDTYKTPMNSYKLIATNYQCPAGTIFTHYDESSAEEWKLAEMYGEYKGKTEDGRCFAFHVHQVENNPDFEKLT